MHPSRGKDRERRGVWLQSVLGERHAVLQQLKQRRAGVLSKLQELLATQEQAALQQTQTSAAQLQLQHFIEVTRQRKEELAKVREQIEAQKQANAWQRSFVNSKAAQLSTAQISVAPLTLPNELRTLEMAALHASLSLLAEQRSKMTQLLDVLPLRVSGIHSNITTAPTSSHIPNPAQTDSRDLCQQGNQPVNSSTTQQGLVGDVLQYTGGITVSLCGHRLPDTLAGWQAQQGQALCAVLGYALLLLELAASYLGAPLLHEGSFQGSTSVVWQQQTFWNRRPASKHVVYPLFLEPGLVSSAMPPLSLSSKSKSSGATGWALPLVRAMTSSSASLLSIGSSAPSSSGAFNSDGVAHAPVPNTDSTLERKHADFKLAFEMLQRSCLCLVRQSACDVSMSQSRRHSYNSNSNSSKDQPFLHSSNTALPVPIPGSRHCSTGTLTSALCSSYPDANASLFHQQNHGPVGLGVSRPLGITTGYRPASGTTGSPADSLPLPHSWGPWGCLVVLCAAVLSSHEDDSNSGARSGASNKLGGVLPAAAQALQAEAAATPTAWHASLTTRGGNTWLQEEVAEEEGWDVVNKVLPPPPSSDDIEQYARAIFSDGNANSITAGSPSSRTSTMQSSRNGDRRLPSASGTANSFVNAAAAVAGEFLSTSPGTVASPLGLARLGSFLRGNANRSQT